MNLVLKSSFKKVSMFSGLGFAKISSAFMLLLLSHTSFAESADVVKVLMSTSEGDIELSLNAKKAPKSVKNFVRYAEEGFYEGTIFHRVIKDFMIQGGGFDKEMVEKTNHEPILNEATNGLKNSRGTISMARTLKPNTATSQFFINSVDNAFLDPSQRNFGYAVFGKVSKGMDVVDKISKTGTGAKNKFKDVPLKPIIIKKVTILD